MPLNYRAMPETDCTQLPKVCIISLYKRISKPCLSILNKGVCVAGSGGGVRAKQNPLSGRAKLLTINYNSLTITHSKAR